MSALRALASLEFLIHYLTAVAIACRACGALSAKSEFDLPLHPTDSIHTVIK